MGQDFHGVLQGLAAQQGNELLKHVRGDNRPLAHQAADFFKQAHDPGDIAGRPAERELVATDMKIDAGELGFNVAQRLVMATKGLNHLIRVVEDNNFRPGTRDRVWELGRTCVYAAGPGPPVQ
ncbi:hypothetical protein GCM10023063_23240 [Arthrobacter methylotrophus]